jgi:hypothetical protein
MEKLSRPQSTERATKSGVKKFMEWQQKHASTCDLATVTPEELNNILRKFYAEVKHKDHKKGKSLTPSSLTGLRASLHRHLIAAPLLRPFNIIKDKEFTTANNMFAARCRLYYKAGNEKPQHKPCIEKGDLEKLGKYFSSWNNNPQVLVEALWFNLCYFFGRRGREGWTEMTKDTFEVKCDSEGHKFVSMKKTEVTKNHQGGHKQIDQDYCDIRMYGQGVDIYEFYISKANSECHRLFQTPNHYSCNAVTNWFRKEPMGKNTLSKIMQRISQNAGLSKSYTCHSVRATTISTLFRAGVSTQEIMSITKHKNQKSLSHYIDDMSEQQKRGCSSVLGNAMQGNIDTNDDMVVSTGEIATIPSATITPTADGMVAIPLVSEPTSFIIEPPVQTTNAQPVSMNTMSSSNFDIMDRLFNNGTFHNCQFNFNLK